MWMPNIDMQIITVHLMSTRITVPGSPAYFAVVLLFPETKRDMGYYILTHCKPRF